jgi:glutamate/tyrosine decarboxylase-like PLP-dependent enzyme
MFESNCSFAQKFSSWIDSSEKFEKLAETRLNIVCFRGVFDPNITDTRNQELLKLINLTGKVFITPTIYKEKFAYRVAVSNWQTDHNDLKILTNVLSQAYSDLLE